MKDAFHCERSLNLLSRAYELKFPKRQEVSLCIFGGTGFVGRWLVESLVHLGRLRLLDLELLIVTRDANRAKSLFKYRPDDEITFLECDLDATPVKNLPHFSSYVMAATSTVTDKSNSSQNSLQRTTSNAVESINLVSKKTRTIPHVVNLSSGAVYKKSRSIDHFCFESDETHKTSSDSYTSAKLHSEMFLDQLAENNQITNLNLRLFSFYGPGIPLDKHFAIGNFMRDILRSQEIEINGHPSSKRSYLYGGDLALAIIDALSLKIMGKLNIGGRIAQTMEKLSKQMNTFLGGRGETVLFSASEPNYYYPNTDLSRQLLGDYEITPFDEGLREWRTYLVD